MKGNYIGNNPNGLDFVLVDNKTTIEKNKKIVSKDIAINGDDTDLASGRGIFNAVSKENVDYNTLVDQGVYSIPLSGSTNGPGYAAKLLVYSVFESPLVTQVAIDVGSVAIKCRYKSDKVNWTPWETVIFNTDTATSSKAGIVQLNNTVTSTSASQAATANAVKLAYDKAVEAYTKAESAQGSSASADKLTTARTIQTNLASTASASFDGTENVTPGVTGVLPVANGGTGRTDGKAPSLVTKRTIDGVNFDGSANIHHYGTCSTAADTAAKTVALANFVLATGAIAFIRFTVTNTASSPTLNINATGAKAIRYRNAGINASHLAADRTYCFIYDGSYYQLVGDIDTNTKYTAASAAPKAPGTAAVGTSTKYAREDHVHPLQTTVSGNAGSATKLAAKRTIDGVSFDGSANIHHYGTCSTDAGTAAKTVTLANFVLATGAEVTVRFTVTNTASNPTLNVNGTGDKAILYRNAAISAGYLAANRTYRFVYDGSNYQLVGDIDINTTYVAASATPKAPGTAAVGTSGKYAREDHVHPLQTTVSGNAGSATKLAAKRTIDGVSFDGSANIHHYGTCSTDAGTAAKTVTLANFVLATGAEVTVRFTVTNTASNPTLNVNGTGDKAILYRNAAISAGYLAANRTYRFVYDGSNYQLVGDIDINTTYVAASATPKAPGTAAVGTSGKYAREDHVHPLQTTVSGNAGSATKLATARTIDGVSFNGTANITHFGVCSTEAATAAKTVSVSGFTLATGAELTVQFTVTNTAASPTLNVNGTGAKAIVYRNAAISASYLASNRVYKFVYDGTNYELIGDVNTDTNTKVTQTVTTTNAEYPLLISADADKTSSSTTAARFASAVTLNPSTKKITCSGISGINATTTWVNAAKVGGSLTEFDGIGSGKFQPFIRSKSTNGVFLLDGYQDYITFSYLTDENITNNKNTVTESLQFNESGLLTSSGGFKGSLTGNASSATKLATARTIDGVSFNGSANITHFGTCSTEAATAAKVVSVANFVLATGSEVTVQFTVTNTAASPTLNVNGTGAKAIVYRNAAISAGYLAANRVYKFVYDGTNYELIGDIDTNTKYTAASATPKAPGTAAVGKSTKYAREDHVHPLQTTVSGNAGTATKLATARTISLTGVVEGSVSFDGSKNVSITTTADGIGGSIPIGGIIAFSGTFGGTNNRFPIPLGSTTPDTNWCLCDGTKTNNLNVPDLRGRMILGASSTYAAGSTGGSATHTHSISGTVGSTTLSEAQMPKHAHTFDKGTYGDIAEARGSANNGKQWTDATGGSQAHTHSLSGASGEANSLPPYYALAYIMRTS